jgi:hypothetical protein
MVVAKKRTVSAKGNAKVSAKKRTSKAVSVEQSQKVRMLVVCFTALSIAFVAMAFWRYCY